MASIYSLHSPSIRTYSNVQGTIPVTRMPFTMDSQLLQSLLQLNTLVPSERDTLGGQGALRATRQVLATSRVATTWAATRTPSCKSACLVGDFRLQFNVLGSTVCTWGSLYCPMNMSSSAGYATLNTIVAPPPCRRSISPISTRPYSTCNAEAKGGRKRNQ